MRKTACITGASSGIGEEFARQLAARHFDLILVARKAEKMKALAKELCPQYDIRCEIVPCDLSTTEECMRLIRLLKERDITLFINNAGFGEIGYFDETSAEKELEMLNVNVRALHLLSKEILTDFIARDRGYLLNVGSIAGLLSGGPLMATYYATKAYVVSLTSSLYEELNMKKSNAHISVLCPGPVKTNFDQVAGVEFSLDGISVKQCVSGAIRGMNRGQLIIVPDTMTRIGAIVSKVMPRTLQLKYTAHAQRKKV